MLLGAPGSGKSTFVNHLALCLAGAALVERVPDEPQPESGWLARLPGWNRGPLLPIRIVLRLFTAFTPPAKAQTPLDRFLAYLRHTLGSQADAFDALTDALTNGRAILLFDGLDEVVGDTAIRAVTASIGAAAATYSRCLTLVTCRIRDYETNPLRQARDFPTERLAAFSDEQIQTFVKAWYKELAATRREALGSAAALNQAIAARHELRDLARLPLILTMMAVVHAGKGTLPDARALLYYDCIDLLLLRWRRDGRDVLELLGVPQYRASDLLALMARLGFAAHEAALRDQNSADRPADLSGTTVRKVLEDEFGRYAAGDEVERDRLVSVTLHAIAARNGLLLKQSGEQGEVYAFPHRSFQEFLAGFHLKAQRDYRKLCLERAPQAHWHEALALMVGYQALAEGEFERPLGLVEALLERTPVECMLAGELLNLIGRQRTARYDAEWTDRLWRQARKMLLSLATQGTPPRAPASLRVRAASALGTLCFGDLEALSAGALPALPDPRLPLAVIGPGALRSAKWRELLKRYWCDIPAGAFWYGVEQLRQVELPHAFRIGRYPVTNAEYARFVAAGGYHERRWWSENGWKYIESDGLRWFKGQEERITRPRFWDDARFNNPTQPVVGVSWYEAAAYCAWLAAQLGLPEGTIRLPTSLEWERAARGMDQQPYPWGQDEPTPEYANYHATGIGAPSPVGCFPQGIAACGALDMAGNVWEWTATDNNDPGNPEPQKDFTPTDWIVLRGGAYYTGNAQLRCGSRNGFNAVIRYSGRSFRLVWSLALSR
jgi:formylglycine-generating enzyme required for sulfatase activity